MDSRELMLDNYIFSIRHKMITEIKSLMPQEIRLWCNPLANYNYNDIEPIPLTEDILIRCGFEKQNEYDNLYVLKTKDGVLIIGYDTKDKYLEIEINIDYFELKNIEFLHQLQNLIFALTKQKITLK